MGIKLNSQELGEYPYTVKYDVKPATYIPRIEAAPGHKGPGSDFVIESKDIKATAAGDDGIEVSVDIRFHPSALGEIRALLVLSSPDGGDYKAWLVGYTQPPQPQGPVTISAGGKPSLVEFHNPFEETVEFTIQVDNPMFHVAQRTFKLDAKKSVPIAVQFKSDKPQAGRMIITAPKVSTPWIFFLKGAVPS